MSEGPNKKRKTNDGQSQVSDPRFANIHSDPRYRLPSKKHRVKLDKRFKTAFQGEAFVKKSKVDRYGRPVNDDAAKRRLEQKFEIDSEDDSDQADDDGEVQQELARAEKHDPLRDGKLDASSSEEESSDEESDVDVDQDESDQELDTNVPEGEVSRRIALVNLDWDNIRADDLMAVFSSFLPTGGHLSQVAVYPSEFGKERMDREEMEGPPKEIFAQKNNGIGEEESESEDEDLDDEDIKASVIKPDDGSEFDSQALRQYQLERLRYFYAVLTFSTKSTAKHVYDAVDGTEYLSTANFFDLRFVPDEMDFDDKARDLCTTLPSDYKPNEFVTDALQHSKVKLTWDQEDRGRKDAQARAFKGGRKEIDENDLKAYLGSDSSDNEDDDDVEVVMADAEVAATKSKKQSEREKARALLGFSIESTKSTKSKKTKEGPVGDIQITFSSGLVGDVDAEEKKRSIFENSPEPNETTAEKYVRKEKERKQKRKEKMRAARSGDTVDDSDDQANEGEADLGFDDPFFNEGSLLDSTAKNKTRKEDRLKKKQEKEAKEAASAKQRAELELIMAEDAEAQSTVAAKGRAVSHFDMAEIEKAEKRKGKKEKYKKKYKTDKTVLQDDFAMNVADPRLGKLFENHEFAIDPTNQRLRQTSGMKELIQEGRSRKQKSGHLERKSEKPDNKPSARSDTIDLVAKIKRKAM